jgi:S1-C subfamily serine protease
VAARGVLAVLGLLALSGCILTPAAHVPSARELTETAKAATVLVQSDFAVTTSLPDPVRVTSKFDALTVTVQGLINLGQIRTVAAADAYYVNEVLTHPDQYFEPGTDRSTDSTTFEATGSGFFVNSSGDVVTAAHVVVADKEAMRQDLVASVDESAVQFLTESARAQLAASGITPTDAQARSMGAWAADYVKANVRVDDAKGTYHVAVGQSIAPGDGVKSSGYPATVVTVGAPAPGVDVAILSIGGHDLPALALGDESKLGLKSRMVELGYPCGCDLTRGSVSTPVNLDLTVTSGVLGPSDKQEGWTAISTTASGTHGDSGGPVIGPDGKVVGIVSYGYGTSGQTYLVPAGTVAEMISKAGVKTGTGRVTALYREAQSDYELHRYAWAIPLFEQVAKLDPQLPFVVDFIENSKAAIRSGQDRTPPDLSPFFLPTAGLMMFGGLIAPLVGALLWDEYRGRRGSRTTAVQAC